MLVYYYFFSTNVIMYIGRKYIFFINHCGVTTCGQTDQEPVKLSKVSKVSKSISISTQYELSGQVLEEVKDAKYLGVTVSDDLEWTKHINAITTKANSKLSFLRCNLKGCPEKLRETAYFALVRSFLEYSATVWHPHQK